MITNTPDHGFVMLRRYASVSSQSCTTTFITLAPRLYDYKTPIAATFKLSSFHLNITFLNQLSHLYDF